MQQHSADRSMMLARQLADANNLAVDLGTPADWTASAIDHLRQRCAGTTDGGVRVSAAALHLVLAHLDNGGAA